MKVNEQFLLAKKDKNRSALIVTQRMYEGKLRQYMYMCVEERSKYTMDSTTTYVDTDTEIVFDNYYRFMDGEPCTKEEKEKAVSFIGFYLCASTWTDNHINTFLNAIKKESDVKFKVVAYNTSDVTKAAGIVCHQLYGIVDGRSYFLSAYAGADNSASPVQSRNLFDTVS